MFHYWNPFLIIKTFSWLFYTSLFSLLVILYTLTIIFLFHSKQGQKSDKEIRQMQCQLCTKICWVFFFYFFLLFIYLLPVTSAIIHIHYEIQYSLPIFHSTANLALDSLSSPATHSHFMKLSHATIKWQRSLDLDTPSCIFIQNYS